MISTILLSLYKKFINRYKTIFFTFLPKESNLRPFLKCTGNISKNPIVLKPTDLNKYKKL